MSEVKRYHVQLFKLAGDQQKYAHGALGAVEIVRASDYDAAQSELAALREDFTRQLQDLKRERQKAWDARDAAEQRNAELASLLREGLEEFKEGDYWIERTVALLGKEPRSGDDSAYDRAYRNGLMQGYNLALNGSEKEYQDAVARYSNPTESGASE